MLFQLKNVIMCSFFRWAWEVGSGGQGRGFSLFGRRRESSWQGQSFSASITCYPSWQNTFPSTFIYDCLQRDRILERLRESSDRRTPVPDPLNGDDEEAVRIGDINVRHWLTDEQTKGLAQWIILHRVAVLTRFIGESHDQR